MNEIVKQNIFLKTAVDVLFQKKIKDVCLIDLQKIPNLLMDYLLIGTSYSESQMNASLSEVKKSLSKKGVKRIRFEHAIGSRWGVLDSEEVVIHLFEEQTREFYSLEKLWIEGDVYLLNAEAVIFNVPEDYEQFI